MKRLRIVAADSASAILNDDFEPLSIVAVASVLVNPPYREPDERLAEPLFVEAKDGHELVVHEAELCRDLLKNVRADVVHLDMSLGAVPLERLSAIQLGDIRVSSRARRHLLKILPRLRKIAGEIMREHGIEVLAIGKESVPVRIAELTAGAYSILYASERAVKEDKTLLLGLPSKCQPRMDQSGVYLYSLIAAEHDVRGYAKDVGEVLKKVNISEILNPCARGFRALEIKPKH